MVSWIREEIVKRRGLRVQASRDWLSKFSSRIVNSKSVNITHLVYSYLISTQLISSWLSTLWFTANWVARCEATQFAVAVTNHDMMKSAVQSELSQRRMQTTARLYGISRQYKLHRESSIMARPSHPPRCLSVCLSVPSHITAHWLTDWLNELRLYILPNGTK